MLTLICGLSGAGHESTVVDLFSEYKIFELPAPKLYFFFLAASPCHLFKVISASYH